MCIVGNTVTSSVSKFELYASLASITFENTANWNYTDNETDFTAKANGTAIDLIAPDENSTYFKTTISISNN